MARPRSTMALMRGMTGVLAIVGALILIVGGWSIIELRSSIDTVLAVDQAAVAVAQARTAVALAASPQTIAGVDEASWSGLVEAVDATGLSGIYQRDAATIVQHLRDIQRGDLDGRQSTASSLVDLQAAMERRRAEVLVEQQDRAQNVAMVLTLSVGIGLLLIAAAAAWVRGSLLTRFRGMSSTSRRIVDGAAERLDTSIHDPLGAVAAAFNAGLDKQAQLVAALGAENNRAALSRQIADGLDLARDHEAIYEVIKRAMRVVVPAATEAELFVEDEETDGLIRSVVATNGAQCPVQDHRDCAAMRRGSTQRFSDPNAISACPHLSGREVKNATCIPTTFLGHPIGVLHIVQTCDAETPPDEALLSELASTAANRIGTMRAFALEESHASVDPLTGLLNRRAFEKLSAEVGSGVLAMADLDHFKMINDTYGHQVGDQALTLFSRVLTRGTREGADLLCRWGGEEFAILLPNADLSTATEIIGRVRELLARESLTQPPAFTSSWGLTELHGSMSSAVLRADQALYEAKAQGRDRYVVAPTAASFGAPGNGVGHAAFDGPDALPDDLLLAMDSPPN